MDSSHPLVLICLDIRQQKPPNVHNLGPSSRQVIEWGGVGYLLYLHGKQALAYSIYCCIQIWNCPYYHMLAICTLVMLCLALWPRPLTSLWIFWGLALVKSHEMKYRAWAEPLHDSYSPGWDLQSTNINLSKYTWNICWWPLLQHPLTGVRDSTVLDMDNLLTYRWYTQWTHMEDGYALDNIVTDSEYITHV